VLALVATVMFFTVPAQAATKAARHRSGRRAVRPPELVWYVETVDGQVLDERDADLAINPASVVKIATSWWALEALGPDHRFTTRFAARGTIDPSRGLLKGDLIVHGAGDPDFQAEGAFLVAQALNRMGIRKVSGSVVVDGTFWMGWENGSQGMNPDPVRRATLMATRLRQGLDVRRWSRATRQAWYAFAKSHDLGRSPLPSVEVIGGARFEASTGGVETVLFEHRSKTLAETLRRFNAFSNNDIERVAASIGSTSELSVLLADRLVAGTVPVHIQTASGLGENRLTPRQIVAMLRGFRSAAAGLGVDIERLLPVAGCDPGTVHAAFPRLSAPPFATALVAKTGTLTSTDGGITVLAGFLNTAQGEVVFCVAAPRAAGRIRLARHTEESFVVELLKRRGGAAPRNCTPPLPSSSGDATIVSSQVASIGAGGPGAAAAVRVAAVTGAASQR
jgi:D-alanyl-D-alanine carboxypeptidase/D-alanyl-D-alanine-endopeptidase (penicillin-binding protein 4)